VNREKIMRWAPWGAMAAILVAVFVSYWSSIDGEFQYDDQEIAKTVWVREAARFLDPNSWLPGTKESKDIPRPLTAASFAVNHAMDGFRPRVWHITNVLIHLAAVLLAWRVARRLFQRAGVGGGDAAAPAAASEKDREKGRGKKKPAALPEAVIPEGLALAAAGLFGLHPLHTEAVSYISQRSEALASAFYLAGLLALMAYDAAPKERRGRYLAGAVALHFLGLVAKPIAATMPVTWLLVAAVLPRREERSVPWLERVTRRTPAALALLALSVGATAIGVTGAAGSGHAGYDLDFVTPLQYVATQMRALPLYVRLLLWPSGLNADWYFPFSRSLGEPGVLAGLAFLVILTATAVLGFRRVEKEEGDWAAVARLAVFGWLFFLVVLAPTTLVPLRDPFVEHRLYLASLGAILPAAAAVRAAIRTLPPVPAVAVGAAVAVAVLAALGVTTYQRNFVWKTALNLWADASTKAPQKPRIWVNYGTALHFAGRFQEAVVAYDKALALGYDPTVPVELVVRNTALALVRLRRYDEARARLTSYLARNPRDASTIVILALVEVDTNRLEEAERAARAALAIDGRLSRPYQILGQVQEKRNDLQGAYDAYNTAWRLDQADPLPVYSMGRIEERRGRVPEACRLYARATDALARASAARSAAEAYRRLCGGTVDLR
jgi:tetratricopeptide (TPR) repeat protein